MIVVEVTRNHETRLYGTFADKEQAIAWVRQQGYRDVLYLRVNPVG